MWCPKLNKEEQKFLGGELSPLFVFYMKTEFGEGGERIKMNQLL